MKVCAACSKELPKDKFSKKQWQLKQQRRCKECIAAKREVVSASEATASNDDSPPPPEPDIVASSTADNNNSDMAICAACGKGGDGLETCDKCKLVKYCNATCQKAHRPKHKKECKRAAELHDEALFKQPPPVEDCPICLLPLPTNGGIDHQYQACCGQLLCMGCMHEVFKRACPLLDESLTCPEDCFCPFCRAPANLSVAHQIERIMKRVEAGDDGGAMGVVGDYYRYGKKGFPKDFGKAMELYIRSGKLGNASANGVVAELYDNGEGVEKDKKKAKYYYELAAIGGDVCARHNLGIYEYNAGNMNRAVKHWMIAAAAGSDKSLTNIRRCFMDGHATKDDFEKALRSHKEAKDEVKSDQREAAAEFYKNL